MALEHMNSPSTLLLQGVEDLEVPFKLELIKFFNNNMKWHNIKPPFLFFWPFHISFSKNKIKSTKYVSLLKFWHNDQYASV